MLGLRRLIGSAAVVLGGAAALLVGAPGKAQANGADCGSGTSGSPGYAYAGHQATEVAHGVRATITAVTPPVVRAGHVAGWVGVGGPGQGENGETAWIQIGIASLPNTPSMVYAEIAAPRKHPEFVPLLENVPVGQSHSVAVLEVGNRPNWWRVWLDGKPATEPVFLPGSNGRWKPIVTAESNNLRQPVCNSYGFRFERVGIAKRPGGSWRTFEPGYDFLDRGHALRRLRPLPDGAPARTLASDPIAPYAFEALSS
ncbi:MAG: hypothetical protein FJ104_10740 [Deltaproteobacteria bacterium]|nr:hypothetical protein [Deltaproteobacteria bacterium]